MVSVWVAYFALFLLGPKLMKNRKPFELNSLMTMYNLFQVVMNTYFGSKVRKVKMNGNQMLANVFRQFTICYGSTNTTFPANLSITAAPSMD